MSKFWKWSNAADSNGSELILEGVIADESWWGDEVTPQGFRDELKKHSGDKLTVLLNSGGGDVFAGLSIYNALRELDAEVTIKVSGLAASIASIIAMAGDNIVMMPGSMMMIHKPSVFAMGNSEDMEKAKELLLGIEESIIPIYTDRTGLSIEKVTEMMEAETWMSAEEAVALGFADSVAATVKKPELPEAAQNFNGKFAFSMSATRESIEHFITKVAESSKMEAPEVTDEEDKDKEEEQPVAPADPAPAPEPETPAPVDPGKPEVVDPVVPSTEDKVTKTTDKDKKMNKVEDAAKDQIIEPKNQPEVNPKAEVKNYLKTKAALNDFADVLAANAGRDAAEVKAAWAEHVKVKMGITNPEVLLPEGVVQAIQDAFAEGGQIWNLVNKTNLDVFKVAWDTVTGEDSRAKGHTRGDNKAEEVITLDDRTLRAQFIYKYLTLDKETVRENRSTGALLRYVLSELPRRIIRELERAIVIGDGREDASDYKITSFTSVKEDAAAGNTFASTYTPGVDENRYEVMLHAMDLLEAEGPVYLVAKKGWLTGVKLEQGVNGGYLFQPGANLADTFELAGIIKPDWMSEDEDNDAYLVTFSEYRTVGDTSVEAFSNFVLKTNKQEYLQEIYAGGALTARKAAVAIATTDES